MSSGTESWKSLKDFKISETELEPFLFEKLSIETINKIRIKNSFRNFSRFSYLKFREGHLSTIGDNLSNNTAVETGAKNGWIVLDDLTPGFPTTTVPTSSTVVLKNAITPTKNRTNGYPRGFRNFLKSKDKFVFCGELCLGDQWSVFMIILHSFLLVSFIIT